MDFVDISDQKGAFKMLSGVVLSRRVANAYLLAGPKGSGKAALANFFALSLNCLDLLPEGLPCGLCQSCQKAKKEVHPDLLFIEPEKETLKIGQIRELKKMVQFGPAESNFKVVMIKRAETMSRESANSFLKLLEEPPEGVLFLLLSERVSFLPLTIRSRCQTIFLGENKSSLQEVSKEGEEFEEALLKGDLISLFSLAEDLSRSKERVPEFFEGLLGLCAFHERLNLNRVVKEVLTTKRSIERRANLRLALDALFLKLSEAIKN